MNPDQDAHQISIKLLLREMVTYNLCKSTGELALDLNTSQSKICPYLKMVEKLSMKMFYENTQHSSMEETLRFSKITQGHIQEESRRKKLDLGWLVLPHPLDSPDLASSYFHFLSLFFFSFFFSFSTKCSEWQQNFSRRSGENVWGKLLEPETSSILLERTQKMARCDSK